MDLYHITTQRTLETIARHCPRALGTYLNCINRANKEGTAYFSKDAIEYEMYSTKCIVKNDLRRLANENLLEWYPVNDGFTVTLAEVDDE